MKDFFKDKVKSEVLAELESQLKTAVVLPQVSFLVKEWQEDKENIYRQIMTENWCNSPLIVRSSAFGEDSSNGSLAGHYSTVMNVLGISSFHNAVEKVISSYDQPDSRDCILVQPQLDNVIRAGVAFTFDPTTNGSYYVINLNEGADTTIVTSGVSNAGNTWYIHRSKPSCDVPAIQSIVDLCREVEKLVEHECIDIEFAEDINGQLYLLQVRPLIVNQYDSRMYVRAESALEDAARLLKRISQPHPYLKGQRSILGIMPDWNPAEIIGSRPRPLALSLYKQLVTDRTWAYQRDNYGYQNLRSFPLLFPMVGCPYVDVRASFNSFIPKGINDDIAGRLVDYYISCLEHFPAYHDKIEFEIVFSCYTPNLSKRLSVLTEHGFSLSDIVLIESSLKALTNRIIHSETGLWRLDLGKIEHLKQQQNKINESDLDDYSRIYWLTEDCQRYGTLPFAGLARVGFIAAQFLDSLKEMNLLSDERYKCFMMSINTVSTNLAYDFKNLKRGDFLSRYGHLRPGTYDIRSSRYDEDPSFYFDWSNQSKSIAEKYDFELTIDESVNIQRMLDEHGIEHTSESLFRFLRAAIEGREYSKFVFTRSLSDVLSLIKRIGERYGFSADDCSYLNFQDLLGNFSYGNSLKDLFINSINKGRRQFELTRQMVLPQLITSEKDLWQFNVPDSIPNFITQLRVSGDVVCMNNDISVSEITGKIIFIQSADPGYDWILSERPAGFITEYGGPNSHMAIRAAELSIPAVIGVGASNFSRWKLSRHLIIDCQEKIVQVIS